MGSDQRASSRGREQITIAIETDTRHPPETRAGLIQMVGSCGKVRGGYSRVITAELGTCRHCTGDRSQWAGIKLKIFQFRNKYSDSRTSQLHNLGCSSSSPPPVLIRLSAISGAVWAANGPPP